MNTFNRHVVVSGGTGFIGRHFVYRLLQGEPTTHVTLLVRGNDVEVARRRVRKDLACVANDLGDQFDEASFEQRVHLLLGDVTLPVCGVRAVDAASHLTANCEFWHMAASLNFEASQQSRIRAHNIEGSEHALELAEALGARRFVHVSTAYVCGDAIGSIKEQLHDPKGRFNNFYEHSKCQAEHCVASRATERGMDFRILRPSVVVGLSDSFAASGGNTGLYGFARELIRLRRALDKHGAPVRVMGDREATVNLIPVDELVAQMQALRDSDFSGGTIHHLTSAACPTVAEVLDGLCDGVGVPRLEIIRELPEDALPIERLLARRLVFYSSYLRNAKTFERTHTTAVDVPGWHVRAYVRRYLEEHESNGAPRVQQRIEARDGFPLMALTGERPERETVVLVNALGMPSAALEQLGRSLGVHYNVLTWQSRGAPSLEGALDLHNSVFTRQADDLEDVMKACNVKRAHLIGWCTGADVALAFAQRCPERVATIVSLNGALLGFTRLHNEFQRNLTQIVRAAVKSLDHARVYHGLLMKLMSPAAGPASEAGTVPAFLRAAVAFVDPDFAHITTEPLRSAEAFHRYCMLLAHYFDEAPRSLPELTIPTLVVSAEDDPISHPGASRLLAAALPAAHLKMTPTGGHFLVCRDRVIFDDVLAFLAEQRSKAAPARDLDLRCA